MVGPPLCFGEQNTTKILIVETPSNSLSGCRMTRVDACQTDVKYLSERRNFSATNSIARCPRRNSIRTNVAAGQQYIGAYVEYIHYVERIYRSCEDSGARPFS